MILAPSADSLHVRHRIDGYFKDSWHAQTCFHAPATANVTDMSQKMHNIRPFSRLFSQNGHSNGPGLNVRNRFLGSKLALEHIEISTCRFQAAHTSICSWKTQLIAQKSAPFHTKMTSSGPGLKF